MGARGRGWQPAPHSCRHLLLQRQPGVAEANGQPPPPQRQRQQQQDLVLSRGWVRQQGQGQGLSGRQGRGPPRLGVAPAGGQVAVATGGGVAGDSRGECRWWLMRLGAQRPGSHCEPQV